ncbi:MAG: tyrosine-type recombinase/integrase [Carbonactinosporaceae bacterium]
MLICVYDLAYTGLRFGEASALRVRDLDLGRRRVLVVRAYSDVAGRLVEDSPKAHQARSVPLVPLLVPLLERLVVDRGRDDLVFTTDRGAPLRLPNCRRQFNKTKAIAGLDHRLTTHGLRHTAASLLIQAGTSPKALQIILGHSSITMTLDLYGHLYPDEMDRWATPARRGCCGQPVARRRR